MRIPGAMTYGSVALGVVVWAVSRLAAADGLNVDLKPGDRAPAFEAVDDRGQPWKSTDHVGKKYVVLYFYPGDFTPGCTAQARSFRDNLNKLAERGVVVVGVSGDSV